MSEFSERLAVIIDAKCHSIVDDYRRVYGYGPWEKPDPNPFPRIRVFPWWR